MNYVKSLEMFGVDAKEIPCILGVGAPQSTTPGAVGLLYMDSDTGSLYKCIGANGGVYTWTPVSSGTKIQVTIWEGGD